MKIAVLGAGAMGCLYGGRLARAGEDVSLIDIRVDHIEAINSRGLVMESGDGEEVVRNARGFTTAEEAGPADLVIVFVKAVVTGEAIVRAKSLIKPETMVLTLQNGLGNAEKLSEALGPGRIVVGVTSCGASVVGPGRIRLGGAGDTVIGELTGEMTPRLEILKNMLEKAGFPTGTSDNVAGLIWSKLIGNIGINALAALTGLKNGRLLDYPETEQLLAEAVGEAVRVAEAAGIKIAFDDPVERVRELARKTGDNRCSMLQDVAAKRTTEISAINGAVVEMGRALNIPTPVNHVLTNLVTAIQKTYNLR